MKIEYKCFEREDQLSIVKRLMEDLQPLIPKKILTLTVVFIFVNDENVTVDASVSTDPEYRQACITLYSPFFCQSEEQMVKTLTHEILHIHFTDVFTFVEDDMIAYVKEHNEPLAEQFRRNIVRLEEGLVVELENFITESISGRARN